MADDGEFQVVRSKKGKKSRHREQKHVINVQAKDSQDSTDGFDLIHFNKRLNNCVQEILVSDFFSGSYDTIISALSSLIQARTFPEKSEVSSRSEAKTDLHKEVEAAETGCDVEKAPNQTLTTEAVQILSYGIGNFTSCLIARYQLAFLIALREKLGKRCQTCSIFDPMFTNNEKSVLESYDCLVITENEEGKRKCLSPTIAFLPHCGKALYNNLLWRNCNTEKCVGLSNLLLIGNSFSHMVESTPGRVLKRTASYILKLSSYTREVALPNTFTHKDVFNDLSIHTFPAVQLETADFLRDVEVEEPVYADDDVEFIRK